MVDLATELKSIWYLLIALVGIALWLGRLHSLAHSTHKTAKEINEALGAAFKKIDAINERLPVMQSKIGVMSDMLKPDKLAEFHTATATFQAETQKDIERLMDAAKKAGVF